MQREAVKSKVDSPGIKQCKLDKGICQGCYRTLEEISTWRGMSSNEKLTVLERICLEQNQ